MTFNFSKTLHINSSLRKELSRPFGKIVKDAELSRKVGRNEAIYAIGDVTVAVLLKFKYKPKVAIFDYRTERSVGSFPIIKKTYKNPLRVKNRSGTISKALWIAVKKASKSKSGVGIRVFGEEDMASLVCTYFAKEGDLVMYGMRNRGMAVIRIDKRIKKYVVNVLNKMSND